MKRGEISLLAAAICTLILSASPCLAAVYAWHTFYGAGTTGSTVQEGYDIAVDGNGNIYVTGQSNVAWNGPGSCTVPGTPPCPINPFSGGAKSDIFILKLNSSGAYQWHTFYGSSNYDMGHGIALDGGGNIYVTGRSSSTWGNNPVHPYDGGYTGADWNLFVLKLNNSGAYQWHTFYHGYTFTDYGYFKGIAADANGNVYIAGESDADWGWGSPIHPFSGVNGDYNVLVLKLNTNGIYQWHTFYGVAGGNSFGNAIAWDRSGNVYVTGEANAAWNGQGTCSIPNIPPCPLNPFNGNTDIFVLKLNSSGAYQWHTFYGSVAGLDAGYAVSADNGNVYVTGSSTESWGTPRNSFSSGTDAFVLKLSNAGAYQWHTFYGPGSEGLGIATDSNCNVYVSGHSAASWGSPLSAYSGAEDIFLLKLGSDGAYDWNTFYGSASGWDFGDGITTDSSGNIYVTGTSTATWNGPGACSVPGTPPCPLNAYNGKANIVILKLQPDICALQAVRRGSPSVYYTSISDAYSHAVSGDILQIQAMKFTEDLDLSAAIDVTLSGGYECNFLYSPVAKTIMGKLTISGGMVTVENIIVN